MHRSRLKHLLPLLVLLVSSGGQTTIAEPLNTTSPGTSDASNLIHLRIGINCTDRNNGYEKKRHANYVALVNYVGAVNAQPPHCATSMTLTTHGDYRYLDNVGPLAQRWQAPISVAIYAPGTDFKITLHTVLWLRQCDPQSELIRKWVNFHVYYPDAHKPKRIYKHEALIQKKVNCSKVPAFKNEPQPTDYRKKHGLNYPISVGRNIAKEAAQTHYVLPTDIDLYPSAGLASGFMHMLEANQDFPTSSIVYPLNIFEVEKDVAIPATKAELKQQLAAGQAVPFHSLICPSCNRGRRLGDWLRSCDASNQVKAQHSNKYARYWDPIHIGTIFDAPFDERLSWEQMAEKRVQYFALCLLGYEFHTLDNAFLVHRPGVRKTQADKTRLTLAMNNFGRYRRRYAREYVKIYGRLVD